MSRYIDVDAAMDEIIKDMCGVPDIDEGLRTALSELRLMPTANVVEVPDDYNGYKDIDSTVKKTRWQITIDNGFKMYTCPECECRMIKAHYDYAVGLKGFNYCPYCGADMRGKQDD